MKCVLIVLVLATGTLVALSECTCNFTDIHMSASACLSANNVAKSVDFMLPILENHTTVINFCTRTLIDIKSCMRDAISSCNSNHLVHTLFGGKGAALLAAYEGICSESTKVEALTCSYPHAPHINAVAANFYREMDEMTSDNKSSICAPLMKFHELALVYIQDAVHTNHCSHHNYIIIEKFLQTVQFKCNDVATSYYPCTASKINSNAVACFARSSVTVRNAIVPAPGLAHSDIMCSSRDTILNCIKDHLTKCMNEEQVMFIGTGKEYSAAYECMCGLNNADMVLSCPSTADTADAVTTFFNDVHKTVLLGELGKQELCTKLSVMKSRAVSAIKNACMDERYQNYWNTFLATVSYPCTEKRTTCYPHMQSGSDPNMSLKLTTLLAFLQLCLTFLS